MRSWLINRGTTSACGRRLPVTGVLGEPTDWLLLLELDTVQWIDYQLSDVVFGFEFRPDIACPVANLQRLLPAIG